MRLDYQVLLKSPPPPKITGSIRPCHADIKFERTDPSLWKCHG